MPRTARAWGALLASAGRVITSPAAISGVLLIAGITCTVSGIHVLAGSGWALVAAGIELLLLAVALLRGLIRGG